MKFKKRKGSGLLGTGSPRYLMILKISLLVSLLFALSAHTAAQTEITGKVTDENNEGIPGVNIYVKGTTQGTISDLDGNYSIGIDDQGAIIVFSFVGYASREVPAEGLTEINVNLVPETIGLQEVIAIGYGTQVRKNLSSAVSKVDVEKLASTPLPSFEVGLQGRAAGVQVTTSSALGGSAIRIRVRGTSSASANSEPLYVIDGIPVESGEISSSQPGAAIQEWNLQTAANTNVLASLNPQDIQSIEILKDAAAAAIYGSRGANGVVLITTKKGQAGGTQVSASASFGISEPTHVIPLLNSEQYLELAKEAWTNDHLIGLETGNQWLADRYDTANNYELFWTAPYSGVLIDGLTREQAENTNTNWADQVLQNGFLQEYNVSASGGNEKTVFFISGNIKDETTILKGNHYQRFGTRLNVEHQLSRVIKVGGKMMLTHINDIQVPTSWAGGIGMINEMLPIWPVKKEDGSYFNLTNNHPVASVELRKIHLSSNQVMGNWFLSANIIPGLTFRTEFGTSLLFNDDFHYRDGRITDHGRTISSTVIGNRTSWNWKNVLNYKKRIGDHSFDVLGATDVQQFNQRINTMYGDDFFNSTLQKPTDAATKNATYFETSYAFVSYIGRMNYNFRDRYLVSFSMRADGSSRFAENNRWGYFPAVSLGYIISEEGFFDGLKNVFNYAKLRGSYGIVGNAEIGDYTYVSTYRTVTYNANTGVVLQNLGDDKLGWESTTQFNVGLNLEAFNGRIAGEFDYYYKYTTDLLLPYPVSQMTGVSSVTRNVGELSNRGFEIMLNTINIQKSNFTWETNLTLGHNKNKVEYLSDELASGLSVTAGLGGFSLFVNEPVGVQEMAEWDGVDPQTGEDAYMDLDGNRLLYSEVLTQYGNFTNFVNANRIPRGNPWPLISGGLDNRFTYKSLYLNMLITYATGLDRSLGEKKLYLAPFGTRKINPTEYFLDRWQNPGDQAAVSRPRAAQNIQWPNTTEHLHKTDYLRIRNLTFGWNKSLPSVPVLKGVNLYLTITNLWTITNSPDFFWDPEYAGVVQAREQNNLNAGQDYKTAPQARFYMAGIQLNF